MIVIALRTTNKWNSLCGYAVVADEAEADQVAAERAKYFLKELRWEVSTQENKDAYDKSQQEFADGLARCSTLD